MTGTPENGTAYLQTSLGDSLVFSFSNGDLFDLLSVDLAEYSTVVPDAATVRFIGYRPDGSTVTRNLTTDGVIDGTGPLADFQTFAFTGFTGLSRVEVPGFGWSLDNLRVTPVPEPATGVLLLAGGLAVWIGRVHKRKKSAFIGTIAADNPVQHRARRARKRFPQGGRQNGLKPWNGIGFDKAPHAF